MNVLEKIFKEIEDHAIEFESFGVCDDYVGVGWVKEIIRSYMDDGKDINVNNSDAPYITLTLEKDVVVTVPAIDYELLSEKIAEKIAVAMKKAPIQPVIQMEDGDVVLNGERVGRKLAPVISRIQAQNT